MKQCPRCASEININDKVCPRCGLPVSKMSEANEALSEELSKEAENKKLNRAQKKEKKRLAKQAKKEAKKKRKLEEKQSNTDFSKFAANAEEENKFANGKKRKKGDEFKFEIDENGEFNIDTKDVEIIGEEVSKAYEERRKQKEYSIKKARGDYRPPKVKWWEIYKLADRAFARKKIKKEVSKAAKVKPDFISKAKLLILAILFGWCGAHNFYAKNKKKGFTSLICISISILSMALSEVPFFKMFELWLVGFTGFIVLVIWISDVVNIMFNRFNYRIQKDKFIAGLNIETRAKLGEKYIDLELLHKPWWVRFKVWCEKKKRDYYEWKQERRQAMIEKEKAKLEKQEEKDKINEEIAEFERKELENLNKGKVEEKTKRPNKGSSSKTTVKEDFAEVKQEEQKETPKKKTAKVTVSKKTSAKNSAKKK